MGKQHTIAQEVSFSGVGLHTGELTTVTFRPAEPNSGIIFHRIDLPGTPAIKASVENVGDLSLGTTIESGEARVGTIEHVLATIYALELDNLNIDVDGGEMPNADGSALPFLGALKNAGLKEQDAERNYLEIKDPIHYRNGDGSLSILPADNYRISVTVDFPHQVVGTQYASFEISPEIFESEIAPSRTFCFLRDVKTMQEKGLAKGGSLEDAVVIGDDGYLNETLRFKDEVVRHKILDVIGDLCLLGRPIKGHIVAAKPGHAKNCEFSRTIYKATMNGKSEMAKANKVLDVQRIMNVLPHRYPFLLVDRILSYKHGEYATGIKNVTANEPFFQGHWPGEPVMPGVLIIEAMAQVSSVLIFCDEGEPDRRAFFMGIDKAKFRRTVVPGDQIVIEAEMRHLRRTACKVHAVAKVDGKIVAQAEMMFGVIEKDK